MKTISLFILLFNLNAFAADPVLFPEVFTKVIETKCLLCHSNPAQPPADLRNLEEVMKFVVAGDVKASKLAQVTDPASGSTLQMPPPKFLEVKPEFTLTDADRELIQQWIEDGALAAAP